MATVRHCPRCGSDYRPEIPACAECGGPLEDRPDTDGEDRTPDRRFTPPPLPGLPEGSLEAEGELESLYFSRDVRDLEPVANRLGARGIPFGIRQTSVGARAPHTRYDLMVPEAQLPRALQELQGLLGSEMPEAPESPTAFDPERGYLSCPACGSTVPEGSPECTDCGLTLAGQPEGTD